jgi:alpha-1,6-mannosyltransferase
VTVALDTIMWRPPEDATRSIAPSTTHWPGATGVLWPEGRVAFFNTVLNKSSEWGVSPWHWYFTSALPRALTVSYPLSLVGAALERRVRAALAIGLFYVVVISRLPHKELRFVFPTLPLFTACAAAAVGRAWTRRAKITRCVLGMLLSRRAKKKTRTKRGGKYKRAGVAELIWALFAAVVVLAWCLGVAAHVAFALAARCNYPGGVALARLHALRADVPGTVHVDADAATTGASRFGQVRRVLLHTGSHTTAFAW